MLELYLKIIKERPTYPNKKAIVGFCVYVANKEKPSYNLSFHEIYDFMADRGYWKGRNIVLRLSSLFHQYLPKITPQKSEEYIPMMVKGLVQSKITEYLLSNYGWNCRPHELGTLLERRALFIIQETQARYRNHFPSINPHYFAAACLYMAGTFLAWELKCNSFLTIRYFSTLFKLKRFSIRDIYSRVIKPYSDVILTSWQRTEK